MYTKTHNTHNAYNTYNTHNITTTQRTTTQKYKTHNTQHSLLLCRGIDFPDDMHDDAKDLISKLLVKDASKRLAATPDRFNELKVCCILVLL